MGIDTRSCCIHTWDMGTYADFPRWSSCLHWLSFRSCRVCTPSLFLSFSGIHSSADDILPFPPPFSVPFFTGWKLCCSLLSGHLNLNWLFPLKTSVKSLLLFSVLWYFRIQRVEIGCRCFWNLFNRLIFFKFFFYKHILCSPLFISSSFLICCTCQGVLLWWCIGWMF